MTNQSLQGDDAAAQQLRKGKNLPRFCPVLALYNTGSICKPSLYLKKLHNAGIVSREIQRPYRVESQTVAGAGG